MVPYRFKRLNTTVLLVVLLFVLYSLFFNSSYISSTNSGAAEPISLKNIPKKLAAPATPIGALLTTEKIIPDKIVAALEASAAAIARAKQNSRSDLLDLEKLVSKKKTDGKRYDLLDSEIAFMPKMTNETLKAELGNAAWKLFHTILARYPTNPTAEQQSHLSNYINFFAKVYPCGDCARHFQELLQKFPPQLKSRSNAAVWGCHVHNKVNELLKKPEYDCSHIIDDYDCGCGEDEELIDFTLNGESMKSSELSDHMLKIELDSIEETAQLG